ncbi:hypothetical protein AND_008034 [Anopheles darlingi]|uniref:Secreted protein n=1 Tax=Anopheles darlingi TaxID=43151 RepID=W5J7C4_ANODA|nr:hypothetical protein AND_008034 [Anopheles darlingi]
MHTRVRCVVVVVVVIAVDLHPRNHIQVESVPIQSKSPPRSSVHYKRRLKEVEVQPHWHSQRVLLLYSLEVFRFSCEAVKCVLQSHRWQWNNFSVKS